MNEDEKTSVKDFFLYTQTLMEDGPDWEISLDGPTIKELVKRSIEIAAEKEGPPAPKGRRAAIEHTRRKHAEKQKRAEASESTSE